MLLNVNLLIFFKRHYSSLVCMIGITYVYTGMVFGFNRYFFFNPSLLLSWMFEHDCLDTYCFGCLICMFCIFVFALIQGKWTCFTQYGTLEIHSLLLICLLAMIVWPTSWTLHPKRNLISLGGMPAFLRKRFFLFIHPSFVWELKFCLVGWLVFCLFVCLLVLLL